LTSQCENYAKQTGFERQARGSADLQEGGVNLAALAVSITCIVPCKDEFALTRFCVRLIPNTQPERFNLEDANRRLAQREDFMGRRRA